MAYTPNRNQQRLTQNQNRRREAPNHTKARRAPTRTRMGGRSEDDQQKPAPIQNAKKGDVRILILGGVSEIGKNMYAIEYNDSIVVLECGTMFAESITPGVEKVMADIQYLKDRKDKIRAVVITDAPLTHIGAIPHCLNDLGKPTIYTRQLTKAVIENHQKSFRNSPGVAFHEIEKQESLKITDEITLHFFGVKESTPSTLGVLIETPAGCIAYTGNLKIQHKDGVVRADEEKLFEVFEGKKTLLSLSCSIGAERAGFAISDEEVTKDVAQMLKEAPYRTILTLFPSQIKRNSMILEEALNLGKKIYIEGTALLENLQIATDLGVSSIPKEALIPIQEMEEGDELKKVIVALTGAENEEYESLEKISQNDYAHLSVLEEDTIIFPAPIIPTNARATQNLKDRLSRMRATIRAYDTSDVKASAQSNKDELKWMHQRINPKYFIPVKGYHYMLTAHTHILRDIGVSEDSCVVPQNGSIIDISQDGSSITKQKQTLPSVPISVDGHSPAPIQEIVIQERKILSEEGILIIIVFLDPKKLVVSKSPDIISRGFIYLRESQDLISRIRIVTKQAAEKEAEDIGKIDIIPIKKAVQKKIGNFLLNETNKRPMVIPVIFT